ncbi:transporter [Parahaliea mediterranea]|uniref:Transporter n=1 Tax=Parahaliea mediterranea TaxID=651086 RepID=A0A939DI89_9GAMM|nr:transporter [Parahaliea mediterranea]MBN7798341.1 transporter [Parahaliea mediterranea]
MPKPATTLTLSLAAVVLATGIRAQELSPRAYWPAPRGTQVLTVGAIVTRGDTVPDPSLPISGLDSSIDTVAVGYLRTLNLWGRSANIVLEAPFSDGETVAEHPEGGSLGLDYSGLGDISATLSVNLLGAPSMNREEFTELRRAPRPILGASLKVVAPTGEYDSERLINVGANRWAAKAELGYIQVLSPKWLLELEVGAWVFGDNDDFLGRTRSADPLYTVETHLVRRFRPGFWLSLDANYYHGGRGSLDGRRLNDLQRDSKFGATLVYPVADKQAVKLSYASGSVNDSNEEFDIYTLSYQLLF